MAITALKLELPVVDEGRLGGLSGAERSEIYANGGYTKFQIAQFEGMVANSGLRVVGKGALNNLVTHFASLKNHAVRVMESHTCERMFAYLCELDPDVLGYYVQVPCRGIVRTMEGDRKHVSHATLDFLVFWRNGVELVECKAESWLLKQENDGEWARNADGWICDPYKQWADEHGLAFRAFALGTPFANHLRTLEAMYATLDLPPTREEMRIAERSLALLAAKPYSIEAMEETLPGFNGRIALAMLARRQCYGLVTSTPISLPHHFYLYSNQEQARLADTQAFTSLRKVTGQPVALDALSLASTTDYQAAVKRYKRVLPVLAGEEKGTVRLRRLAAKVREAVLDDKPALSACLTQYSNSGNRQTRLDPVQQECMSWATRTLWNTGKARTRKNLWFALEKECQRHQVATPSIETLCRHLRQEDAAKRALASGGMRAYQAARPISDPLVRSGKALAFGHTLHIDSSQFDSRSMRQVESALFGHKPWFYAGVDEATDYSMARSMYFGQACTNGVALLLRDFVRRNGFLPFVIILDRGSENDSNWLKAFCLEKGITLIHTPTGGSRYNSQAETAIRRINISVAHDLPGSTEPDQKGRKVDGKYKSINTARLTFTTLLDAFDKYFFDDLPNTPNDDDRTPLERKDEAISRYGVMGHLQQLDDDFLIKTSVNVHFKGKATEKRGIKLPCGIFTSGLLTRLLRTSQPDEVRQDCENKALVVVNIAGQWVKAFLNSILTEAARTPEERLFDHLVAPYARRNRRNRKRDVDRARYDRHEGAVSQQAPPIAPKNMASAEAQQSATQVADDDFESNVVWESIPCLTEE